jgi:hypothetical protein
MFTVWLPSNDRGDAHTETEQADLISQIIVYYLNIESRLKIFGLAYACIIIIRTLPSNRSKVFTAVA